MRVLTLMIGIFFLINILALNVNIAAEDLRMVLATPMASFHLNESGIIHYYVQVENKNNFIINININQDKLNFSENPNFALNPNETKQINFSYLATKNETLSIPVVFSGENKSFSLTETIIITINSVQVINTNSSNPNTNVSPVSSTNSTNQSCPGGVCPLNQTDTVNTSTTPSPSPAPVPQPTPQEDPPVKKNVGGIAFYIALLLVLIGGIIYVLYLLSMKGGRKRSDEKNINSGFVDDNIPRE